MNNTKKNTYIVLLIISIISNMILLYKKISIKNYYKESYLVLQDGKQINIYSIDDSKKQRLKKIDNIQAMVGIVTKLEGKNNNFAVIFNEQRKCDYSVNLNQNNKVSINDKLIVFYSEEVPIDKSEIIYCTVWICNITERGIIEIMTTKKGLQRMVVWYNAVERRMLESRIVV